MAVVEQYLTSALGEDGNVPDQDWIRSTAAIEVAGGNGDCGLVLGEENPARVGEGGARPAKGQGHAGSIPALI